MTIPPLPQISFIPRLQSAYVGVLLLNTHAHDLYSKKLFQRGSSRVCEQHTAVAISQTHILISMSLYVCVANNELFVSHYRQNICGCPSSNTYINSSNLCNVIINIRLLNVLHHTIYHLSSIRLFHMPVWWPLCAPFFFILLFANAGVCIFRTSRNVNRRIRRHRHHHAHFVPVFSFCDVMIALQRFFFFFVIAYAAAYVSGSDLFNALWPALMFWFEVVCVCSSTTICYSCLPLALRVCVYECMCLNIMNFFRFSSRYYPSFLNSLNKFCLCLVSHFGKKHHFIGAFT